MTWNALGKHEKGIGEKKGAWARNRRESMVHGITEGRRITYEGGQLPPAIVEERHFTHKAFFGS
jgi:hypothetical protein